MIVEGEWNNTIGNAQVFVLRFFYYIRSVHFMFVLKTLMRRSLS